MFIQYQHEHDIRYKLTIVYDVVAEIHTHINEFIIQTYNSPMKIFIEGKYIIIVYLKRLIQMQSRYQQCRSDFREYD
jgi:hypothetical protein